MSGVRIDLPLSTAAALRLDQMARRAERDPVPAILIRALPILAGER